MYTICSPRNKQEFEQYYNLRWKILRKPWQQPPGSEKDELEEIASHYVVLSEDTLIGVARLHLQDSSAVIRYMAIDTAYQRKGAGSMLLDYLQQQATKSNAINIMLDAREIYARFYLKNGFIDCGAGHTLYNTIHHRKMIKIL